MAVANLQGLSKPDDIAAAWARFLIEDIIEHREAKTRPVLPGVYVFGFEDGTPTLPTMPEAFNPEDPTSVEGLMDRHVGAYAYLAVMPGLPIPKATWEGQPHAHTARLMLGVPANLIEDGDFPWYLMACFYSATTQITFCGAFDGEVFQEIKSIYGVYGGVLPYLLSGSN